MVPISLNGLTKTLLISRHVGTFADSIQHKLDLVVEGHQMLSEKIDRVEEGLNGRIDCVVRKLDAVAAQGSATAVRLETVSAKIDGKRSQRYGLLSYL